MAIPAVRFNSLDTEFNVAMTSIKQSDPSVILNSASNSVAAITKSILSSISSMSRTMSAGTLISDVVKTKNSVESALGLTKALSTILKVESAIRKVRGILKSTLNTDSFSSKDINNLLTGIFKNDPVVQGYMRVLNNGKNLFGDVTTGKPYRPTVHLPSGAANPPGCSQPVSVGNPIYDYDTLVKAIDKVSNSNYPHTSVDNNALLRQTVILGNLGYDANMTGVMKALSNTPNMTPDVLARAISIVMTEQSTKGNATAVIDMSIGATAVITTDNSPISFAPSIITDTMAQFTLPPGSTEQNMGALGTALVNSIIALDPNWNISDYDAIPSTQHIQTVSSDVTEVLSAMVADNTFSESDLTITFGTTEDCVIAAMIANDPNGVSYLRQLANQTSCCIKFNC